MLTKTITKSRLIFVDETKTRSMTKIRPHDGN